MKLSIFKEDAELKNIEYSEYGNGALAVVANIDFGEGYAEPVKLSVNIAEGDFTSDMLEKGQFHCPAYSENQAMFSAFLDAGLIEVVGGPHPSGFVMIDVCQLTEKARSLVVNPEELNDVDEFRKHLGLPANR